MRAMLITFAFHQRCEARVQITPFNGSSGWHNAGWRADELGSVAALTRDVSAHERSALLAALRAARRRLRGIHLRDSHLLDSHLLDSHLRDSDVTLHALTAEDFPGLADATLLADMRAAITHGRGALLVQGLPALTVRDATILLWGIGCHLGVAEPQDAAGALLHHVRDNGGHVTGTNHVRGFETNASLDFHNDGGEAFVLYCLQQARHGGDSFLVSALAVYSELRTLRPDLAAILEQPFAFDARAQQLDGERRAQYAPIFVRDGQRLHVLYKRGYIQLAQRFPEVPRLSGLQIEALNLLDKLCWDPRFHLRFRLRPCELLIANNFTVLHARTRYDDESTADPRHLLRLWLSLYDGVPVPEAYARTREFGMTWRRQKIVLGL